ncbi:MAG: hypothetical protein Q4Q03_00515 [Bowdeniella nasicola]|nr:hypothetical protein [Bowdeniella nasicola]
MKSVSTLAALTLAAALTISGCSNSTGSDNATTPAPTTAAPSQTSEAAPEKAGPTSDELAEKFAGVKLGDSELTVEEGDGLLEAVASGASDAGFEFDPHACAEAMFGPYERILATDSERAVGTTEEGITFVLLGFATDEDASDFITESADLIDQCATYTVSAPAAGEGSMSPADITVADADDQIGIDAITTLDDADTPMSQVIARKGNIVVVATAMAGLASVEDLAATSAEVLAN